MFLALGVLVYLGYGRRRSRLAALTPAADAAERAPSAV
ncbi:hypothetical protein [Streptomyces cadmiisoli]